MAGGIKLQWKDRNRSEELQSLCESSVPMNDTFYIRQKLN